VEGATYAEIAAAAVASGLPCGSRARPARRTAGGRAPVLCVVLSGGTTSIEAKSGYGLVARIGAQDSKGRPATCGEGRLRYVPTFLGAHEVPDEYRGRLDAYADLWFTEMLPRVAESTSPNTAMSSASHGVSGRQGTRHSSRRSGPWIRTAHSRDQFTPDEGALLAAELGADTPTPGNHGPRRPGSAQGRRVQPVCCRGRSSSGFHALSAARQMIDLGLAVVLATDFNRDRLPLPPLPMVLPLASTQMRMTPGGIHHRRHIQRRYSLRRGHQAGWLDPGKLADFVITIAATTVSFRTFSGGSRPGPLCCAATSLLQPPLFIDRIIAGSIV